MFLLLGVRLIKGGRDYTEAQTWRIGEGPSDCNMLDRLDCANFSSSVETRELSIRQHHTYIFEMPMWRVSVTTEGPTNGLWIHAALEDEGTAFLKLQIVKAEGRRTPTNPVLHSESSDSHLSLFAFMDSGARALRRQRRPFLPLLAPRHGKLCYLAGSRDEADRWENVKTSPTCQFGCCAGSTHWSETSNKPPEDPSSFFLRASLRPKRECKH